MSAVDFARAIFRPRHVGIGKMTIRANASILNGASYHRNGPYESSACNEPFYSRPPRYGSRSLTRAGLWEMI